MRTALLLIDLQHWIAREFLSSDGTRVTAAAAEFLEAARTTGRQVVHIRYLRLDGSDGGPNSDETSFLSWVRPLDHELVVNKFGRSAFDGTPLHQELLDRQVETLQLAGIVTEGGILTTALDAVALGYRVRILTEAVESASQADHDAALRSLVEAGCDV